MTSCRSCTFEFGKGESKASSVFVLRYLQVVSKDIIHLATQDIHRLITYNHEDLKNTPNLNASLMRLARHENKIISLSLITLRYSNNNIL